MRKPVAGGGFHALRYTLAQANRVGWWRLWKAMRAKNACKTCALGMGGQYGGMVNELRRFPEFCKKSLQAMTADMQGEISDDFFRRYSVRQLRAMSPRELETTGRLVKPLHLAPGATHYRPIGWDEALQLLADRLQKTKPEEAFFYFSGRSSNEAGFLLQLFARIYGTNHVNNCSYYCHQASGVGLTQALGAGTATIQAQDIEHADLFFLIGGNPASNHPRLMTHLLHLRRKGGNVIVVNPVKETGLVRFRVPSDPRSLLFGTKIATHYAQVHIGGDIAWLVGVAKGLLALGGTAIDHEYLKARTEGWDAAREVIETTSWNTIEQRSGVYRAAIEEVARVYAASERAIFAWTMGITHHVHGVENVQWITNLALMRGMVGKKHAGLLPIRGHSNVQGMGTIGVAPELKGAMRQRFEAFGVPLPAWKGADTLGCLDLAHAGKIKTAVALGGNLWGATPDAEHARAAIASMDLVAYLNTSLNTGHAHGLARETLILPVLARDEEPYQTTQESMFSYVRVSDGGEARHQGPRGEVWVAADLAARVLGPATRVARGIAATWGEMASAVKVREVMADLVPGMEPVRAGAEFHIAGRVLGDGAFPTPTGKARMFGHPVPPPPQGTMQLMTVRSEGQFNTVVYEDDDLYRGQERRDVVLLNPADMQRLGLERDDPVVLTSAVGEISGWRARPFDIKEGNVLVYYPESNVLVPRTLDPQSRTPAFKAVGITVRKMTSTVSPGMPANVVAVKPKPVRGTGLGAVLRRRLRPRMKSC